MKTALTANHVGTFIHRSAVHSLREDSSETWQSLDIAQREPDALSQS